MVMDDPSIDTRVRENLHNAFSVEKKQNVPRIEGVVLPSLNRWLPEPTPDLPNTYTHVIPPRMSSKIIETSPEMSAQTFKVMLDQGRLALAGLSPLNG